MKKRWYYKMFNPGVTAIGAITEIEKFLNKNDLKPEEFKVVPTHVYHTGYNHTNNLCGFGVLYYSEKELT